jgi:hypothetical protein
VEAPDVCGVGEGLPAPDPGLIRAIVVRSGNAAGAVVVPGAGAAVVSGVQGRPLIRCKAASRGPSKLLASSSVRCITSSGVIPLSEAFVKARRIASLILTGRIGPDPGPVGVVNVTPVDVHR